MIISDGWEITGEQLEFLEALGKGEFGTVYKGILISALKKKPGAKIKGNLRRTFRKTVDAKPGKVVAIKMIHGMLLCAAE